MASSSFEFEVSRFDGKVYSDRCDARGNLEVWRTRVKDLLALQGLSKALLSCDKKKPAKVMDGDEWEEMQAQACATIRSHLSDDIVCRHLMGETWSPREMWDKLAEQFMPMPHKLTLFGLRERLLGLKMQEGADLAEHIDTLNQLVAEYAKDGVEVDDEDIAVSLLCSLPESYCRLVSALTAGKDAVTMEGVVAALLAHDEQRSKC